jgi:hypothetical protein
MSHQIYNDSSTFRGDIKRYAQPIVKSLLGFSDSNSASENLEIYDRLMGDDREDFFLHGQRDEKVRFIITIALLRCLSTYY